MAKVYDISVRYSRTVQPRDYESVVAEVALKAAVPDSEAETYGDTIVELLNEARAKAHAAIKGNVEAKTQETAAIETKRKPGRPKKAGEPAPAAGLEKTATEASVEPDAGVAGADAGPDLSAADDFSDAVEADIPDSELQKEASAAAKRSSAEKVRDLIASFGVARVAELAPVKRADFVAKAKALK